jgi:hypothetical protein
VLSLASFALSVAVAMMILCGRAVRGAVVRWTA